LKARAIVALKNDDFNSSSETLKEIQDLANFPAKLAEFRRTVKKGLEDLGISKLQIPLAVLGMVQEEPLGKRKTGIQKEKKIGQKRKKLDPKELFEGEDTSLRTRMELFMIGRLTDPSRIRRAKETSGLELDIVNSLKYPQPIVRSTDNYYFQLRKSCGALNEELSDHKPTDDEIIATLPQLISFFRLVSRSDQRRAWSYFINRSRCTGLKFGYELMGEMVDDDPRVDKFIEVMINPVKYQANENGGVGSQVTNLH
jgi:hypothetical protein